MFHFSDFAEFKPWRPAPEGHSVELNIVNDSMANGYIISNDMENPPQIETTTVDGDTPQLKQNLIARDS